MVRAIFSIFLSLAICTCSSRSLDQARIDISYEIIQRRELQVSQAPSTAPELPSFDGDLDAIMELALAKAARSDGSLASPSPAQAPSILAPTNSVKGSFQEACDGITTTSDIHPFVVTYFYSLETLHHANIQNISLATEVALGERMASAVLMCLNDSAASARIVMIDSKPQDKLSTEATCVPEVNENNICTVWEGYMEVYIMDQSLEGAAINFINSALQITLDSSQLADDVHRLVRTTFISTSGKSPTPSAEAPTQDSELKPNLGLAPTLVLSLGSAAVLLLVGSVYYLKRSKTSADVFDATTTKEWNSTIMDSDGTTTNGANSTIMDNSNFVAESPSVKAPPGPADVKEAYGYPSNLSLVSNAQSAMSAIAEELSVSDNSSAIIMSEAGFSEDNDSSMMSLDMGKSNYVKYTEPESPLNLLGARALNPTYITANFGEESDSDLSSDMELNFRSTTPIPLTGTLLTGGMLDPELGGEEGSPAESSDDEILLFTH